MMRAPIDAMHSELDQYAAQLAGAPVEAPVPDYAARAADRRAATDASYGADSRMTDEEWELTTYNSSTHRSAHVKKND